MLSAAGKIYSIGFSWLKEKYRVIIAVGVNSTGYKSRFHPSLVYCSAFQKKIQVVDDFIAKLKMQRKKSGEIWSIIAKYDT